MQKTVSSALSPRNRYPAAIKPITQRHFSFGAINHLMRKRRLTGVHLKRKEVA